MSSTWLTKNITLHVQEPPELDVPLKLTRKEDELKVNPEEDIYSSSHYWDILRWASDILKDHSLWFNLANITMLLETQDEKMLYIVNFFNYDCVDWKSLSTMLYTQDYIRNQAPQYKYVNTHIRYENSVWLGKRIMTLNRSQFRP